MQLIPSLVRPICLAFVWAAAMAWQVVAAPTDLPVMGTALVVDVIDGDTLVLVSGRQLRLTGIQAPKLALGRNNFADWPLADNAKDALTELSHGRAFALHRDGNSEDRHGRILAHAVSPSGLWLQSEMVGRGMARVYTFADNRSQAADLYAQERRARAKRRGIWSLPFYAIRPAEPESLARDVGTFQIVEGTVFDAAQVRSRIYLNFGRDYRQDFTVSIDRAVWSLFSTTGLDPLSLEGKPIRVRGWIKDFNGPLIDVTHPEQIELLSADQSGNAALID